MNRTRSLCLLTLTFLFAFGAHAMGAPVSARTTSPLSISVSTSSDQFKIGSPIEATITLTNTSDSNVTYEWETPEPAYRNFRFTLISRGRDVETTPFHRMLRSEQRPDDPVDVYAGSSQLVTLSAGQSVTFKINVEKMFKMTLPGSYELVVDRNDKNIELQSLPIQFTVIP